MGIIRNYTHPINVLRNNKLSWGAKGIILDLLMGRETTNDYPKKYLNELIKSEYIEVITNKKGTVIKIIGE